MRKNYFLKSAVLYLVAFTFFCFELSFAQTFTDSNLPIVIINTDVDPATGNPSEIIDMPRVLANMKIIKHPDGSRNYLSDQNTTSFLNYSGRISIEIRGKSSQEAAKKQFALTTLKGDNVSNNNVSIFDMPKENDWILNGLAFEPSFIRDYLCYNLSRQMGNYATRTQYCEVVINGDYRGLYVFQEKVKVESGRVNILKMGVADIVLPNLTGGYIVKSDKLDVDEAVAWTMSGYRGSSTFIYVAPKPTDIKPEQGTYIEDQFENLAETSNNSDANLNNGFPTIIDIPSFIDFSILNEISSNTDGYTKSTYYHKDRNGKLRAGPIWDHNITFGNTYSTGSKPDIWQFDDGRAVGPKFWKDLFNNPTYRCYLSKRWNELTQSGMPLSYAKIEELMDSTLTLISEAKPREYQRWERTVDYDLEIANMKTWLQKRINWITDNIGTYNDCNNISIPSLTITKINYNPSTLASSDNEEFIEIKNTGNETVNLSGVYFRELGLTYQFPYNSTIDVNQTLILASNTATFQSKYGYAPFGQYTRNLSNKGQKIILADAFGNVIDTVDYSSIAPWPTTANGTGKYLELIDTNLDNSLASNWKASDGVILNTNSYKIASNVSFYPNPTTNFLTINASAIITQVSIYNALGNLLQVTNPNTQMLNINFNDFESGFYIVKCNYNGGFKSEKIIKK